MRPIHPAIVHFPVALMTFSVVIDLLGYLTNSGTLQAAGFLALLSVKLGAGAEPAFTEVLPYTLIAGLFLGINYIYTRNLWFSIFFHFSWNFFQPLNRCIEYLGW